MIGHITGRVIDINEKSIIVDVRGIGYLVHINPIDVPRIEEEVSYYIETVVREDAIELFGFKDKKTKDFFMMLISISGIGPRGAMGILALAPIDTLTKAVAKGDIGFLTKVSGIGKKTGEKIILELRDKIGNIFGTDGTGREIGNDAYDALSALGYSSAEIRQVLQNLPEDIDVDDTQAVIRSALKIVSKG